MTSGNHIWAQREAVDYIGAEARLLRPANFPAGVPGNGSYLARTAQGRPVGVINVMGRVFMQELDNPVRARARRNRSAARAHARSSSSTSTPKRRPRKIAMGWHLDGKVTAVVGTHTHVQTADEQILPGGTAYLTDVGHDRAARRRHRRRESAPSSTSFCEACRCEWKPRPAIPRLNGILIAADEATGKAHVDSTRSAFGQRTGT